jgi:hypothetical protein
MTMTEASHKVADRLVWIFALAVLLVGIGHVAILPPFEGFDETAHLSRIKSVAYNYANQGLPPAQATVAYDRISADIHEYYRHGPMPGNWLRNDSLHRDDPAVLAGEDLKKIYWSYGRFFTQPDVVAAYIEKYRQTPDPAAYLPGPQMNWQYQHPPTYYDLFGLLMHMLDGHYSLVTEMLLLRLANYFLAFAGFIIGMLATVRHLRVTANVTANGIATLGSLSPFLLPIFFGEFCRLGNDNLCLFLFGIIWSCLLRHLRDEHNRLLWVILAVVMGVCCIVKATMIGSVGGIMLYLFFRVFKRADIASGKIWQTMLPVFVIGTICAFVGGYWYVDGILSHSVRGSLELNNAFRDQNFFADLWENFSAKRLMDGLGLLLLSAVWLYGTLSVAVFGGVLSLVLFVFIGAVMCAYGHRLKTINFRDFFWLPAWVVLPLLAGLMLHIFIAICFYSAPVTPGRYFQILAPAIAMAVGIGLSRFTRDSWGQYIVVGGVVFAFFANLFIFWAQMAVYAGCGEVNKISGYFEFQGEFACLDQAATVVDHVGVLAWPALGISCFGLGWLLLGYGLWQQFRARKILELAPPAQ